MLLRIEDLDPVRSRPEFIEAIELDLDWLGLRFAKLVLRQACRLDIYRDAIQSLAQRGLAYPCFCSRGVVSAATKAIEQVGSMPWPRDPDGAPLYAGTCRTLTGTEVRSRIAAGMPHGWRLDMEAARSAALCPYSFEIFGPLGESTLAIAEPKRWGDVVIGRRDVPASYHLAVVIDDEAQGISHVVRGADLKAATDIHVLLQHLLGCATPRYHHHDLIRDDGGDKLAKSRGSQSLADLRAAGWTPEAIRARLGFA